jgi:hypothetical protein
MVLRGHEHVVECAEFAPVAAYASIRKLAGLTVSAFYGPRSSSSLMGLYIVGCDRRRSSEKRRLLCGHWV